ncbi:uncharacterized protein NPIL_538091 [Nephila pilipes]|uniref:Uncharacterized protein n=1 Tax=Nephila pilipes TaxID=299642 RepID=A0A8X6P8V0_NEPPI|nr:uncharacterized protein NPIL_538091 [Nephila pilipes]
MYAEIDKFYDAISDLQETSYKSKRLSKEDLPRSIWNQLTAYDRLKKNWLRSNCHFDRKLLKKSQTKCKELISAYSPRFCHEFVTVTLDEKGSPCEVAKKYKITKHRMTPLAGSNTTVFTQVKMAQEVENEYLKDESFISATDLLNNPTLLYCLPCASFPEMQSYKRSELTKHSKTSKTISSVLNRIVKDKKNLPLLSPHYYGSSFLKVTKKKVNKKGVKKKLAKSKPASSIKKERFEKKRIVNDRIAAINLELCQLFIKAIGNLIGGVKNFGYVRRYFDILRSVMDSWCEIKFSSNNEFKDSLYYRIAYIYRNSSCISNAVAEYFLIIMNQHPIVLEELLQKKELRICSIGEGSPLDVIAIIKVLENAAKFQRDLDIYVSIIAMDKKWRNTCITVLQCLKRFRKATWKIDFMHADLPTLFNDKVKNAIINANVVSMVKFFSEVNKLCNTSGFLTEIFQNVHTLVQPGAVVFVLDSPVLSVIDACGGYSGMIAEHYLLYETLHNLYTSDTAIVEHWFRFCNKKFRGDLCNTCFCFFSRVWVKPSPQYPNEYLCRAPRKNYVGKRCEVLKSLCATIGVQSDMFLENPTEKSFQVFIESLSEKKLRKKIKGRIKIIAGYVINEKRKFMQRIFESKRKSERKKSKYEKSIFKFLKNLEQKYRRTF